MNEVIFVTGPSGLNKLDVAKKIDALMPDYRFNVLSTSDMRETLRLNSGKTPVDASLAVSTIGTGNSVELLKKQSQILTPTIETTVNYYLRRNQNVIVAGTVLPGLYQLDANVKNYVVYTEDFNRAIRNNKYQEHKLKHVSEMEIQQKYLLQLAKEQEIPIIEYLNQQDPARTIARNFRVGKNPQMDFSQIEPKDIAVSIMGVTGSGKTSVARELMRSLDSYLEGISMLSTDSSRASLKANIMDADAVSVLVSTHLLDETQLSRQSQLMKPYLQGIQKRRNERGSPLIIEGVNAPKTEAKYSVNALLVVSEESLRKRFQLRNSPTDREKLEKIKEIMGFQNKLIAEAKANGWKIIQNESTPQTAACQILKELESLMQKRVCEKE